MKWMEALYDPNGVLSTNFTLANSTRQGCPFSPLLFILTLEPLLRHIRSNSDITGVQVGRTSHKIAAFADDLLFLLPIRKYLYLI